MQCRGVLNFFVEGKRLGVGGFSLLGVGGFVVFDNPLIILAGVEGFSEVTGLFTPGVANNKLCLLLRGVVEDGRGGRAITLLPWRCKTFLGAVIEAEDSLLFDNG